MEIQGNVFVITGGASGLGEATARMIAAGGGKVHNADMNAERGETLAAELGGKFVKCNVSSADEGKVAVDAAVALGTLRGVINCAGIGGAARTVGKDGAANLEAFSRVINVNLIGTFNMIRLGAAAMANNAQNGAGERGVIINTASVAAFDGQIGQAAYSASKGGVVGMTLPIARDLARECIRVVTIAPGLFLTPMLAGLPQEAQDSLGKQVPFPPRLGRPDEYAALAKAIIENQMLNGETIRLDGAIRMAPK